MPPKSAPKNGGVILVGESVRVWSEVGCTLPIGDTFASFRFSFGHERIAKNSTQAELTRTTALIDEFNAKELEARVEAYKRLVNRILAEGDDEDPEPRRNKKPKPSTSSVRDRARKKIKE